MATSSLTTPQSDYRWDLVESQLPVAAKLTVRQALIGLRDDVLIGIDAAKRRHVLIKIPPTEPYEMSERTSRGISVQSVEMNTDTGMANFVEITCIDEGGHAALDIVIRELIDALNAGASIGRVRLVHNVLAKWRRFWSGMNQGTLSREQQLGLFGELWFLNRWLAPSVGAPKAIQMWRGPTGARNDFESPGLGIEVKATSRIDAAHVIHGLEQLMEPLGGSLLLFSVVLRDEASGIDSLPKLVEETRTLLVSDFTGQSQFDTALYSAGYDDRHASDYGRLSVRVRSEELYRVTSSFPRLVPASISNGLPSGISAINYELRLEAATNLRVANSPKSASALLADFVK